MKGWLIDGGDEWLRDGERSIISGPTSRELPTARASRRDFAREVTSANSSSGPSRLLSPSALLLPLTISFPRVRLAHTSTLSSVLRPLFSIPSFLFLLNSLCFQRCLPLRLFTFARVWFRYLPYNSSEKARHMSFPLLDCFEKVSAT